MKSKLIRRLALAGVALASLVLTGCSYYPYGGGYSGLGYGYYGYGGHHRHHYARYGHYGHRYSIRLVASPERTWGNLRTGVGLYSAQCHPDLRGYAALGRERDTT